MDEVYIAKRNFSSHRHNGIEVKGTTIPKETFSTGTAKRLMKKGLIGVTYSTKEDKRAAKIQKKVVIEHDERQYYFLKRGDEVIDRIWGKKKAKEEADELNS